MSEHMALQYKPLFEVRILHHYWLDDGETIFDLISDQAHKESRMASYNLDSFLQVKPALATKSALKAFGGMFIGNKSGFFVITTDLAVIPDKTIFEFYLTAKDPNFTTYTSLTLPSRKIYEIYDHKEKKNCRYKENVFVWSNVTGASRGTDSAKSLFLSKDFQVMQPDNAVEALILKDGGLWQLTSDQPEATLQEIGASVSTLPVFANQADSPALTAPDGLSGVPKRGVLLADDMPDDLFGIIQIAAVRPSDSDFSVLDNSGHAKNTWPVFQLRLRNRSTFRHYFDKRTSSAVSNETAPLPLTFYGNAGKKQKPGTERIGIESTGDKITKIVSMIFI